MECGTVDWKSFLAVLYSVVLYWHCRCESLHRSFFSRPQRRKGLDSHDHSTSRHMHIITIYGNYLVSITRNVGQIYLFPSE
jgi:hypothetical protein